MRYLRWTQIAGRGRPFKANTDTRSSAWLPRLGVVYKLDGTKSLYASYSQSLKPVSSIAPHESGMVIDSRIAPEKGVSWEMGAKLDVPGGLTGTLAIFDIDKKNVLVKQYNDALRAHEWHTAGRARSRGVELDLAGEVGKRWSVIGSLAWLDAKITRDPLYTGKRPGDTANSFWLPGYTVADAFASYEIPVAERKMRVQLNIKNLFDKTYYPSANNQYGLAVGDARQIAISAGFEF